MQQSNFIETIRPDELRAILKISNSTYYRMLRSNQLPQPLRVTDNIKVFDIEDVETHLGFSIRKINVNKKQ